MTRAPAAPDPAGGECPPAVALALAAAALRTEQDALAWTWLKRPAGGNALWCVAGAAGEGIVVKRHVGARGYAQELRAYREWLPHLPEGAAPRLLASEDAGRILVLTRAPGRPVSRLAEEAAGEGGGEDTSIVTCLENRDSAQRRERAGGGALATCTAAPRSESGALATCVDLLLAHAAAGRLARALHQVPSSDPDPLPLVAAIDLRVRAWGERAAAILRPGERDALRALAGGVDAFAGVRRVPCHRDFTPDNWLFDGTCFKVLDLEHARLDAAEADLVKLRAEVWPARPDLRDAFLAGHGPLTVDAAARLDVLLALHAAATLAWAHRRRDPHFEALGRRALAAALAAV